VVVQLLGGTSGGDAVPGRRQAWDEGGSGSRIVGKVRVSVTVLLGLVVLFFESYLKKQLCWQDVLVSVTIKRQFVDCVFEVVWEKWKGDDTLTVARSSGNESEVGENTFRQSLRSTSIGCVWGGGGGDNSQQRRRRVFEGLTTNKNGSRQHKYYFFPPVGLQDFLFPIDRCRSRMTCLLYWGSDTRLKGLNGMSTHLRELSHYLQMWDSEIRLQEWIHSLRLVSEARMCR